MVAFILPANSASSGDFITNSLRLNDSDTPRLVRTPSTAGNRRTFSISFWQKKGNTDHDNDYIISLSGNDDATNFEIIVMVCVTFFLPKTYRECSSVSRS